ncbi:sodium/solute symporter, partial [Alteromonas sp. KUL49]|uniref:SLC5 family protein n=1 Tax=Alteromonas sp. KUL49 TaxID=2480798 RepID=UPI00102EF78B
AIVTVIANIFAFLAPVIYGGGLALNALLDINALLNIQDEMLGLFTCIAIIGCTAGIWAIWGGLKSVAWMDLVTIAVMIVGGISVTIFGLIALGGDSFFDGLSLMIERNKAQEGIWKTAVDAMSFEAVKHDEYDRLSVVQPLTHQLVPWSHWVLSFFYIGLWYTVINQFLIQRVFAAKDMYHARMGVVFAGYLKLLLPFIVVIPGLIFFAMKPDIIANAGSLDDVRQVADQTYVILINTVIPIGLKGILLAALFGAIQSTVSAVLTSTSTIITMDFYNRLSSAKKSQTQLVGVGRIVTFSLLALSIFVGVWISTQEVSLFAYIQELFTFFAPPFSAVFLLGTFWKRIGGQAAFATCVLGFIFGIALKVWLSFGSAPEILTPYANQGVLNWLFCMALCVSLSFVTTPPRPDQIGDDVTFNFRGAFFFSHLGNKWYSHIGLWSGLCVALMFALIISFSIIF